MKRRFASVLLALGLAPGLTLGRGPWEATARAQSRSDLPGAETEGASDLPSVNTAPPGATGPYVPGAPTPQPQPPAPPSGAPAKKAESTGRYLYDTSAFEPDSGEPEVSATASGIPETHVVKKGDTLWDISSTYFKDPHYWPKLWALNPEITNPHWIYPGDQVRLTPPQKAERAPVAEAQKPEPPIRTIGRPAGRPRGLFLRSNAFVEPEQLRSAASIVGSIEERQMLATLDEAYVAFKRESPLLVGERYSVYSPVREVRHPATGKVVGSIVQIFGEAEVKSVNESGIARVQLLDAVDGIERGFRVGPLKRQFKLVEPVPSQRDVAGVVLDTLDPGEFAGAEMLVFLDRGKKDGVEPGNRFLVVRRGDGVQPLLKYGQPVDDKRFPRETVGEILVLDVRERYTTGFMMRSTKEVNLGDRVELRRGY